MTKRKLKHFARRKRNEIWTLFSAALLIVSLSGCAITPEVLEPAEPSFDNSDMNSGIVRFLDNGNLEITAHARDRYNSLIEKWGKFFDPVITKDYGIAHMDNGHFEMDLEGADYFHRMAILQERKKIDGAK